MNHQAQITSQRRGLLDTLAENGTAIPETNRQDFITVNGNGADLSNKKQLRGWSKKKLITQTMMLSLIDVATKKGKTEQIKAYWNTYHCLNKLQSSEGRLYGKYCKNRFCTLCLSNRKADILNRYLATLKEWPQPYLVTLTVKAIKHDRLALVVDKMIQGFQRIKGKYRKKSQRKKGKKIVGIKSLECCFNPTKKTYNPHFHLIVPDKVTAVIIIFEWCNLWTRAWAYKGAQHMRPIEHIEEGLTECVKYGTKIFTEQDVNKKSKEKSPRKLYASALDNILTAMKGQRVFDRFGFNLPKSENSRVPKFTVLDDYAEWEYDPTSSDWVNPETYDFLVSQNPSEELIYLLKNCIDLDIQ